MTKQDSLKKRYAIKLGANVVAALAGILTVSIVPRSLGPASYGSYAFLISFFQRMFGFLDAGTSTAFYTKLSQNNEKKTILGFYFYFVLLIVLLSAGFVAIVIAIGKSGSIWPNQQLKFIVFAYIFCFCIWLMQIFIKISDAYALTFPVEIAKIAEKILLLVVLIVLSRLSWLGIGALFFVNTTILIAFIVCLAAIFKSRGIFSIDAFNPMRIAFGSYSQEFLAFAAPLFALTCIGGLASIGEIWMLQNFGGSVEFGYYSIGYQISTICIIFTSALTPLITRELGKAFGAKSFERISELIKQFVPMFFALVTIISAFAAFHSDRIIAIFLGENFAEAWPTIFVMSFYPMHQTYGQLGASVFFATGRTKIYGFIGLLFIVIEFCATFVLLSPAINIGNFSALGFKFGAMGYAAKLVCLQIISTNILFYFCLKGTTLKYWPFVVHQLCATIVFCGIGILSSQIADSFRILAHNRHAELICAGSVYMVMVFIAVWQFPQLIGMDRKKLMRLMQEMNSKIKCRVGMAPYLRSRKIK